MGRGRKVNSNGERSMRLLREKAIEIFSEYGYFQTKISDIVKAANVTQPTFYLYFESKEVLYKDILSEFQNSVDEIFIETQHEFEKIQNSKQAIQNVLTKLFNFFATNPNLTKIGMFGSDVPFVSTILPQKFNSLIESQKGSFQHINCSIHIFIQSLIGSVERVTLSALLSEKMEPEKLAEEIVNIYFSREEVVSA
ncbi:MAG TPA: TetR/AcrR family transcriptional regulator [Ureibacillus sp.]|nr:TetR/AcrR family transcriptional regulator [Ureibacillus sp.]